MFLRSLEKGVRRRFPRPITPVRTATLAAFGALSPGRRTRFFSEPGRKPRAPDLRRDRSDNAEHPDHRTGSACFERDDSCYQQEGWKHSANEGCCSLEHDENFWLHERAAGHVNTQLSVRDQNRVGSCEFLWSG